jgi:hypothetical protein
MPYKSEKQRLFFHSTGAKKAGITEKMVKEWDEASRERKKFHKYVKARSKR